jgi:hypothetical protein
MIRVNPNLWLIAHTEQEVKVASLIESTEELQVKVGFNRISERQLHAALQRQY